MANLRGINLAMQTPFHKDGSIDFARWDRLLEQYLETGMHGFVLSSGTGQHAYLTEEECNKLFATGVKRIDGRAAITAQTSALNLQEVIRRSKAAQDAGVDALMILPPFFEGPKHDDGIFAFYEAVCKEVSIDVIGYNIPGATGIELTPKLYTRLLQLDNFNFIKDSSGDLCKQQALLACGGKILNGADPNAPFSFMLGTAGTIWGCANIFPREAVQLFNLIDSGNHAEGLKLWQSMFPIVAYCWQNDYIPAVKAASRQMGFDGGTVRAPVCEVGPDEEVKIEAALKPLQLARAA
ncbi:MAG: dihydrodipicolinate synthase family protein [Mesorhizobium sp.]|nr:MAG: dihydrodipicolinate synthase family protein [Mesorhizobium sp.]